MASVRQDSGIGGNGGAGISVGPQFMQAYFVGLTGILAGPIFISALTEVGIGLLLDGIVVTLLPQVIGLFFGHYALRMNPIVLLGALAGAQQRWRPSRRAPAARLRSSVIYGLPNL
jgi:hypothetical protein